jgi:multidrug efflux pump
MCARLLRPREDYRHGSVFRASERAFDLLLGAYEHSLGWALRHPRTIMVILLATLGLNFYLYIKIPKGFFPQQDTGRIVGGIQADQSISFQRMRQKLAKFVSIVESDPAVESAVGFTGGFQTNSGSVFIALKPLAERDATADAVIARLRHELTKVPGASLFLKSVQDIRIGGRSSNAQYQYTIQGDDLDELYMWAPKIHRALQELPELADVNSDQEQAGLQADLKIDRDTAARLGLSTGQIDNTLYDAFGQRQVSTIYNPLNQYHVVMEVAPQFLQSPDTLQDIYISISGGALGGVQATNMITGASEHNAAKGDSDASRSVDDAVRNRRTNAIAATGRGSVSTGAAVSTRSEKMVPLASFTSFAPGTTPLAVNHQGLFLASTISFNLAPGKSLSDAVSAIDAAMAHIGVPASIHASFQGTASVFQRSLANEPLLIAAALAAVYIVLGILYESYVHPLTILSTLPSAGVGALLALIAFNTEFSTIALIGVILLIGIVKKNAIMMIDFALDAERRDGLTSREAIYRASLLRFRPIMMTTMAALLSAVPLALGFGEGGELRRPLGIAIVGGLIVSQILTLYTTPVIYLYLDQLRLWCRGRSALGSRTVGQA